VGKTQIININQFPFHLGHKKNYEKKVSHFITVCINIFLYAQGHGVVGNGKR
jgi:hypothetical protein